MFELTSVDTTLQFYAHMAGIANVVLALVCKILVNPAKSPTYGVILSGVTKSVHCGGRPGIGPLNLVVFPRAA